MQYVFLTDGDNGTALVACPDAATAEKVAASGVFSFGDVSAWMMLDAALTEPEKVIEILRGDGDVSALVDAELDSVPILITSEPWASRVLSTARDWTDEEFELAFGFSRED